MEHYQGLVISIDLMFINRITFLVTIAKHIHYGTANPIENMRAETIFEAIRQLNNFYRRRGFEITMVLGDKQFECLQNDLAGIQITTNIAARDEHVPEIERFIRVIKE